MTERLDTRCIVRPYAATEQKRHVAAVGVKELPVEMLAAAANAGTAGVEDEGIDAVLILLALVKVFRSGDADGFPEQDARTDVGVEGGAQVADDGGRLVAMQLNDVKLEVHHMRDDGLWHLVDEDSDSLR